jgi:hypothetical protein
VWAAWLFGLGSLCFLVGPIPAYADLVGVTACAVTFVVGSVLFTAGGALQTWGRAAWWVALTQSAGTLFFNVTTTRALVVSLSSADYDRMVWRPDLFGSICFLISGTIAYAASARHGLRPVRAAAGWWQPGVNLLGCVLFGASAIAGYVLPTGSMVSTSVADVGTSAGAACFLACALPGMLPRRIVGAADT